jgi:hypothetical protein
MLVKSYNYLHPIEDVAFGSTNQDAYQDYGLNIFQMTNNNTKTTKEIVTKELLDFKRIHVDVKDIKNLFEWWEKHESKFPTIGFLTKQFLRIVLSQIEIECMFFLARILTSLKICWLQFENLNK